MEACSDDLMILFIPFLLWEEKKTVQDSLSSSRFSVIFQYFLSVIFEKDCKYFSNALSKFINALIFFQEYALFRCPPAAFIIPGGR